MIKYFQADSVLASVVILFALAASETLDSVCQRPMNRLERDQRAISLTATSKENEREKKVTATHSKIAMIVHLRLSASGKTRDRGP